MKKIILYAGMLTILLFASFAISPIYLKSGIENNIKIPCFNLENNDSLCSPSSKCFLTVIHVNSSDWIKLAEMENNLAYHNYTLPITNHIGNYPASVVCTDGNLSGYSSFTIIYNSRGSETALSTGSCSMTTSGSLIFLGVAAVVGLIVIVGYLINKAYLVIPGSICGIVLAWTLIGCSPIIGLVIGLLSALSMIYAAIKIPLY